MSWKFYCDCYQVSNYMILVYLVGCMELTSRDYLFMLCLGEHVGS